VPKVLRIILRAVSMVVLSAALWLGYESLSRLHSYTVVGRGTAAEAVVFTAGWSFIVLYIGLAIVILIPPALIGLTLLVPEKESEPIGTKAPVSARTRLTVIVSACFSLFGICLSAAILGYVYEATHTEIRINKDTFAYKAGPFEVYLPLREIRRMELRAKSRTKQVEMVSRSQDVNIDLTTFSPGDQLLLLNYVRIYAELSPVRGRDPDVYVWRRVGFPRVIAPE